MKTGSEFFQLSTFGVDLTYWVLSADGGWELKKCWGDDD